MALNTDAHLLLALLRREALVLASCELDASLTGLWVAAKRLGVSPAWKRKLRLWDSALGLAEKI